ncbi:MAG: hypothetical protein HUU57_12465 [Bdellovibrio sp.]|nr:hypothetical protein [Bdellovibrio sp.]
MKIDVKLFGQVKDYFSSPHFEVIIDKESITVAEMKMWLMEKALQPEKSKLLIQESVLATEIRVLQSQEVLNSNGVIFVLPPVCGG